MSVLLSFKIEASDKSSKARAGIFKTDHGAVKTPAFMPVGTQGTVKAINQKLLGEDITFDLQSLLVERHGPNLRNRMEATGMVLFTSGRYSQNRRRSA